MSAIILQYIFSFAKDLDHWLEVHLKVYSSCSTMARLQLDSLFVDFDLRFCKQLEDLDPAHHKANH